MQCSPIDCAWCAMVVTISNANSSISIKVKVDKCFEQPYHCLHSNEHILNSRTSIHLLIHTSSNSLFLNMWNELATTTTKTYWFYLSRFTNISYIFSSSFEDEELNLSLVNLNPWVEDEAMIFKWKNLFTNDKWKRKSTWELFLFI